MSQKSLLQLIAGDIFDNNYKLLTPNDREIEVCSIANGFFREIIVRTSPGGRIKHYGSHGEIFVQERFIGFYKLIEGNYRILETSDRFAKDFSEAIIAHPLDFLVQKLGL